MQSSKFIGLDVHKAGISVAIAQGERGGEVEMSRKFLAAILAHREVEPLLSDEHFSVDGTLVKAWASTKSFQPKGDSAPPDDGGGPDNSPAISPRRSPRPTQARDRPDDPPRLSQSQCRS
jgi:hypothetical protein